MSLHPHYSHPTTPAGPGSDTDLGAVQPLGSLNLQTMAELGQAGTSQATVDDSAGSLDLKGLWRWYEVETAGRTGLTLTGTVAKTAASTTITGTGTLFTSQLVVGDYIIVPGGATEYFRVTAIASDTSLTTELAAANTASGQTASRSGQLNVWNGYIAEQEIDRGTGTSEMVYGAGRVWTLNLQDDNAILGFRAITGKDGNRPAETAYARLKWLLASNYLNTVIDHGYINWTGLATFHLDKNDYRHRRPAHVLADIATITGYNFWAQYHEASGDIQLWCDLPTSTNYSCTLQVSNVAADIDSVTTFAPSPDTKLRRDPSRIAAGVDLPYQGGAVYQYNYTTSYNYDFRDQIAPTAAVKTASAANALATRYLNDNNVQDERIVSCKLNIPASSLWAVKAGMRIQAKFQHFPNYSSGYTWCRILSRTILSRSTVYDQYTVELELTPVAAAASCSTSLTGATHAAAGATTYSAVSNSITPPTGGPVVLLGATAWDNHNTPTDSNWVQGGGWTVVDNVNSSVGSMLWTTAYQAIASPTGGAYTYSGTYTRGCCADADSSWCNNLIGIRTAATAPVQTAIHNPIATGNPYSITLGATPTPGNMLIAIVPTDKAASSTSWAAPTDPGWTHVATANELHAGYGFWILVDYWARCVQPGDGTTWGFAGLPSPNPTSMMEWAIL